MTTIGTSNALAEGPEEARPIPQPPPRSGGRPLHLVVPPPVDQVTGSGTHPDPLAPSTEEAFRTSVHALVERQLIEMLQEVDALQELLDELPAIYEQKFQARLRTVRTEQDELERNNQALRKRLLLLAPGSDHDLLPLQPRGLLAPALRSALRLKT